MIIKLVLLTLLLKMCTSYDCTDPIIIDHCRDKKSCDQCIQENPCCHFCYKKNHNGYLCDVYPELRKANCSDKFIEKNFESSTKVLQNNQFTLNINRHGTTEDIIQIQPQKFNVTLRKDFPVTIKFRYKPAKNYPVELYYLMDLSYSMRFHLELIKNITDPLSKKLSTLTENYKIAFGSFMDKVVAPFYLMDPTHYYKPCPEEKEDCEPGYLFKHRLNFTRDIKEFLKEVKNCKLSANVDNMDGALDALMQILVCGTAFNWSHSSRKLILVPTESIMHTAGDGLLAGIVKPNNEKCLVDIEGNHTGSTQYDYPSMEQITRLLKEKKINVLFAPKSRDLLEYYKNVAKLLPDNIYVGELKDTEDSVLELIERGYKNFFSDICFEIKTKHPHLKLELEAKELKSSAQSRCYPDIKAGETYDFQLQITLKDIPTFKTETLIIEEKNVPKGIEVYLTYIGKCSCENYGKTKLRCIHGEFRCGQCSCESGWTNTTCNQECSDDLRTCRRVDSVQVSNTCEGNGECICGKCRCTHPFMGDYCEYECPVNPVTNSICSGSEHGFCHKGFCKCTQNYTSSDCSCARSEENCLLDQSSGIICSNHGICECNKCICNVDFYGERCEFRRNEICEKYSQYGIDKDEGKKLALENDILINYLKNEAEKENVTCEDKVECFVINFQGNYRCTTSFLYCEDTNSSISLNIWNENCYIKQSTLSIYAAIAIALLVLLLGAIIMYSIKLKNDRQDRLEWARYKTATEKEVNHQNPLYNDPTALYENPLHADYKKRRKSDSEK